MRLLLGEFHRDERLRRKKWARADIEVPGGPLPDSTQNPIRRIEVANRLDFAARDAFRHAGDEASAAPHVRKIIVDLRNTAYIDSAALGMLLILRDKALAAGKTVGIASVPGTVHEILRVANFQKLFEFE